MAFSNSSEMNMPATATAQTAREMPMRVLAGSTRILKVNPAHATELVVAYLRRTAR